MAMFANLSMQLLVNKTGYPLSQDNGQRHYGPPPCWTGPPPPKGSEIFIGKLPRDLYEDELVPIFQKMGMIYELRLMMDFSGSNRGFAFLTYSCPAEADRAINELDNYEIRRGRPIGVCKSVDNCRLFVGGIPKDKSKEEVMREFARITDGVKKVILYPNVLDKTKNRGFAFIEYDCHRSAAMARRKLIPARIPLWGTELAVDWAEPEPEVKEEVMNRFKRGLLKYERDQLLREFIEDNPVIDSDSQWVTVLFARNLTLNTTEEKLFDIFSLRGMLHVEKVKKIRDYAFIHYYTRQEAEFALGKLNGQMVDDCAMEVTWSKPPQNAQKHSIRHAVDGYKSYPKHCLAMNASLHSSSPFERNQEAMMSNGYLLPGACNDAFFPSDSTAYFMPSTSNDRSSRYSERAIGAIGQPLKLNGSTQRLLSYELPAARAIGENSQKRKNLIFQYPQILSYLCQEKGYGEPVFEVTKISTDTLDQESLYTCKIMIPNLPNGVNQFVCTKFGKTTEEAHIIAAHYVINKLGLSDECYDFYVPRNGSPMRSTSPIRHGSTIFDYGPGTSLSFSSGSPSKRVQPQGFTPFDHGQGDGNGRALSKQAIGSMRHGYLNIKEQGDSSMSSLGAASCNNSDGHFMFSRAKQDIPQKSSCDEASWANKNDGSEDFFSYLESDMFKGFNSNL